LRQLGGPDPHFETLAGAGLEMGYRYIREGVFVRHIPELLDGSPRYSTIKIPLRDQLRFIRAGFGSRWLFWAGFRAITSCSAKPFPLWRAMSKIKQEKPFPQRKVNERRTQIKANTEIPGRVSVLIPTINRYPYLRTLLKQFRTQTISPLEIIVVDQTPEVERDLTLTEDFSDLPIKWLYLDQAGQCRSRNLGLNKAKGEYILFIDDDDEIPPDLIKSHLTALHQHGVNISNGVAHEVGTGELPEDFTFRRLSNVFPTNNTMIRKTVLNQSGLFDMAYDHGQRADHDLGMRLYLSGELMVLNPEIAVLHHHAPTGGLREHKARVDTYAASRRHLFKRNLPTVSDIYLAKCYFSDQQVREMLWINVLGTFSLKGPLWKRLGKYLVSLLSLPHTLWVIQKRSRMAETMLLNYPQIPPLREEN